MYGHEYAQHITKLIDEEIKIIKKMKDVKLYQYAVFFTPTEKEAKDGLKPEVLTQVTNVLVGNEQEAVILASRSIPENYLDRLAQVNIVVRPF